MHRQDLQFTILFDQWRQIRHTNKLQLYTMLEVRAQDQRLTQGFAAIGQPAAVLN